MACQRVAGHQVNSTHVDKLLLCPIVRPKAAQDERSATALATKAMRSAGVMRLGDESIFVYQLRGITGGVDAY
jgi:hypothetical protein